MIIRRSAGAPLTIAGAVAGLQGCALLALGVIELASLPFLGVGKGGGGVGMGVLVVLLGGGLAWAGWLLIRVRAGARGPVVVAELIALALAWDLRGSGSGRHSTAIVVAVLAVTALVVLGCLALPSARQALAEHRDPV